MTVTVDSTDFARLSDAFAQLPAKMREQVVGRAMGRSRSVVERTYAQLASARIDVAQKHIKARMRTRITDDTMEMIVRSAQIPLKELGARTTTRGVAVTLRGSYRAAFIAKGKVMRRRGADKNPQAPRLPIKQLFGPNPAGEVERNPPVYEDMLGEIAEGVFLTEIARGVAFMLARLG
ncbi:hypothetical protein Sa4125_25240 [Aureimonas sp. SA4125]|uniref:hypothetical protein n=1 Tax=Aureimonas sp. SA4125 TaxID=2826993 RepID=UPI001CC70BC0|nr:hypothetical protein [Aureimonas sp. SA4125]BDA84982.1 hypothetical protein Sa4125_25240 [Aureimonas sp. SA4125]